MNELTDRNAMKRIGSSATAICVLLVAALSLGIGCADDYRMNLADFMTQQRVFENAKQKVAMDQETVEFDSGHKLGKHLVGPGDVLEIHLNGADGLDLFPALPARIDRHGEIDLPVVGATKVAGLELDEVEDLIRGAFVPGVYKDAVCHVALTSTDGVSVLVVGAVIRPGLVSLRRSDRSLLFAIDAAGGISETASGIATLKRVRRPTQEVTLDLTDPVELRAALTLDPLEAGDIISVHTSQPNSIFVGGLVNNGGPQAYAIGSPVTVLQALAAAGGVRTDVTPKEGTLIRRMPNGKDAHVKLELDLLATGASPNIQLAGGDILWVPETWETKVQDFFNRNVFFRAGVSVNYNITGLEFLNRRSMQSQRFGGSNLQDSFDPLGFLTQNSLLQNINARP